MGTAKNLNVALDGVVQWGRWADGKLAGNDGFSVNALQGFHYAIGALSASLPVSGTKNYVMVGATPVTSGDGSVAVGTATATATFGATTAVRRRWRQPHVTVQRRGFEEASPQAGASPFLRAGEFPCAGATTLTTFLVRLLAELQLRPATPSAIASTHRRFCPSPEDSMNDGSGPNAWAVFNSRRLHQQKA